jgi:hypothetical protein
MAQREPIARIEALCRNETTEKQPDLPRISDFGAAKAKNWNFCPTPLASLFTRSALWGAW